MARAYESLKPRLADCDLNERARKMGWPPPIENVINCFHAV